MKLSFQAVACGLLVALAANTFVGVDADVILMPTDPPTEFPTDGPTKNPTDNPTDSPTISKAPTPGPTKKPTPSPTTSMSPTTSQNPTSFSAPDAPTCPNEDNGDKYYPKARHDYFSKSYWGYSFKVSKYCEYRRYHPTRGTKYYNTVIDFITSAAEVQGGWLLKTTGATLSGKFPSSNSDAVITQNCDGMGTKTCVELKATSACTEGGAVKWVFHDSDSAHSFKYFLDSFVKYGGAGWVTSGTKMCGKKPFCWDGKGTSSGRGWHYGRCYVSREVTTGHCGQYDFLMDGDLSQLPDPVFYERCGDPWKWFNACISTWGCEYQDQGKNYYYYFN